MIHYDYYSDIPDELLDAFVREQEMGRLLTVADDGLPHLGLYPFAYDGSAIEIHLNRADDQLAHLEARPRCAFEVDEILATVPSYWIDPENAVAATAYHRTVLFECEVARDLARRRRARRAADAAARALPARGRLPRRHAARSRSTAARSA